MYRKATKLEITNYNMLLDKGGLGDLIAQLPAIKYILDNHKHIILHVWVHEYAEPLCTKVFKNYPNCKIYGLDKAKDFVQSFQTRGPYLHNISNLAAHLTEHAFLALLSSSVDPKYMDYIQLDPIENKIFALPEKYIVVTTGFTSKTREWHPESVNGTVDYIIKKGYTPVFIGKGYTHSYKNTAIIGNFKADYSKGINLIDKTDLFEAHSIMNSAACTIGLDNGLMHLNSMGKAPGIWGFTSVEPRHRLPYKDGVLGKNCYVVKPDLKCFGCQSNMNFVNIAHKFTDCWYGKEDFQCVKDLKAELFIEQLEKVLNLPLTPAQKADKAYEDIKMTSELNRKIKEVLNKEHQDKINSTIERLKFERELSWTKK